MRTLQRSLRCDLADVAGEQLASGADKGDVLLWKVDRDAVRDEETTWQRCPCRRATCSPSSLTQCPQLHSNA